MPSKRFRLKLFIKRLQEAPPAASRPEALALITSILNAVEDEFSGATANPANWEHDGRLYAPQEDRARLAVNYPQVTIFRSVRHLTLIWDSGAIGILALPSRTVLLAKRGADGLPVDPAVIS